MAKRKKKNNKVNKEQSLEVKEKELNLIKDETDISENELEKVEISESEIPKDLNINHIDNIFKQAKKVQKELETRKLDYSKKIKSLDENKELLENQKKEYQEKKNELEVRLHEYNNKLKEINQLQVEEGFSSVIDRKILDEYFSKLKKQEALLVEKLSDVTEKHEKYVKLILELDTEKMTLQKATLSEFTKNKDELLEEFKEKFLDKENELLLKEEELEKDRRALKKREKELDYNVEDFNDEKEYLEDKAEKKVEADITSLKENIELLKTQNDRLKQEKEELADILKHFGSRDPKKIVDNLNEKEKEIYECAKQSQGNQVGQSSPKKG